MKNSNKEKGKSKLTLFSFLRRNIYHNLYEKYSSGIFSYNTISINYILFNKSSLVVAKFKDYLIYDDNAEFILNYYSNEDNFERLKKILAIYEQYSKIFPNYLVFKENVYMYRNIRKKQKMIDAVNRIKEEEEENRKTIKNINYNNEESNKIFTNSVKEEIKLYLKNTTFTNNQISLDKSDNKDKTFLNCSFSINLLNKNNSNYNIDNISLKRKSFDSVWTEETNGTLSNIINIMKENKITIKNLHHILRIKSHYDNSNTTTIKNATNRNNANRKDNKLKLFNKFKGLDYMIKSDKKINRASKNNGVILKKNILSMNKNKEEVSRKIKNYLTSTLLSTKKLNNNINPTMNIFNSNSIIEKSVTHKQNFILPLKSEKVKRRFNYNSPINTERCGQSYSKLLLTTNLNSNTKSKIINTSKRNKKQKYLYHHQKNKSNNFNYIKDKHVSHYLTNTKQTDNKHTKSFSDKKHRELSPQLKLGDKPKYYTSRILNNLKKKKCHKIFKSNNINKSKLNLKLNNNNSKINPNIAKNKDFIKKNIFKKIKETKEFDKIRKNKILLKTNYKNVFSKSKFNISEYLRTFINKLNTESDITNKTIQKDNISKRLYKNFIGNTSTKKELKNNNPISDERKMNSSNSKSKSKEKENNNKNKEMVKKKFNHQIRKLISGQTKFNIKSKHRKISSIACPSIKNISYYYTNKDFRDSINNIDYSTINTKNNILLASHRMSKESNDLKIGSNSKSKKFFLNMNTIKKKTIIKSPFSSLNIINDNIKHHKKIHIKEKSQIYMTSSNNNNTNNNYKNNNNKNTNNLTINRSDTKTKYKKYLHRKYIKKSCDFNQEFKDKTKPKINILNKINTINTNNLYLSIFENDSHSIETNNCKKNSDYYSNEFSLQSKKKDNNNSKREKDNIFKKVMCLKIGNLKRKKESKTIKNNIIKNDNNLPLPLSLRIDANNFLSKYKGK